MTNPQNWHRVKHVFQAALDEPPEHRVARARELCRDDSALLAEVESLLATHAQAGSFAERPAEELLNVLPTEAHSEAVESVSRALAPGTRLGVYEIQSLVGAGGMGEVYKARDTRLDRIVAIKILLAHAGADDRARERFEREARAVAALSHLNICTLHDIGHHEGIDFLVMEHLVGKTLAARLVKGPLPLEHAFAVAIQVASALDNAHRAGIVHRDLKPGNIFLARSGGGSGSVTAKLLDFGLAKAYEPTIVAGAARDAPPSELTTPGAILGTVQYMAPEQVEGKASDARTDIFAFGAVLYEMLSARRAFDGDSQGAVMAAILEHEPPPLSSVQPLTPPTLDRIVRTCLAKDPDDRWQSARDLLRALTWLRDGDVGTGSMAAARPRRMTRVALVAAATIAISGIAAVAIFSSWGAPIVSAPSVSFSIYPPEGTKFPRGTAEMAVTADGSRLVFVALSADGTRRLWLRQFDSVNARALDGTEGARYPFWAPEGHSIGFFAQGRLKRIAAAGGAPQVLCDAATAVGGAWNSDGTIIFGSGPIMRVSDTGGVPIAVTAVDARRQERGHAWPVFLPDARRFLYIARSNDPGQSAIYQASLDSSQSQRLVAADSNVGIAGTHLLWFSNGSLMAQAYESSRGRVVGEPITVVEHMALDIPSRSGGAFAVSKAGVLAYRSASPDSRLVWFDRTGKEIGGFATPADYHNPWLSPEEKRLAVEKTDGATGRHTIWILELVRGTTSRLVFDPAGAHTPAWSPDGSRIAFSSNRLGGVDLYSIRADGTGGDSLLLNGADKAGVVPDDWSLDGRVVLLQAQDHADLWTLPVEPVDNAQPFLATVALERQGQLSPNMRWMAYMSNESGAPEVYVRGFPGADGKWQVSTHGGVQPRWRRDGKELFYLAADGKLMAADVRISGSTFETGPPRALFTTGITTSIVDRRNHYVVMHDGQRFLVNISAEDENSAPITAVLNWDATLKK